MSERTLNAPSIAVATHPAAIAGALLWSTVLSVGSQEVTTAFATARDSTCREARKWRLEKLHLPRPLRHGSKNTQSKSLCTLLYCRRDFVKTEGDSQKAPIVIEDECYWDGRNPPTREPTLFSTAVLVDAPGPRLPEVFWYRI